MASPEFVICPIDSHHCIKPSCLAAQKNNRPCVASARSLAATFLQNIVDFQDHKIADPSYFEAAQVFEYAELYGIDEETYMAKIQQFMQSPAQN